MEEQGKQLVQNYVQKVLQLQEGSRKFSKEDFKNAIHDLHLSTREEAAIQQEFQLLFHKGSAYYKAESYKKAIEHLEVASHLDPFHLATHLILVDSYKHVYLETHQKIYAEKTIAYCKSGMNIQVYNPYFPKIETFMEKHLKATRRNNSSAYLGVLATVTGIGAILVAGLIGLIKLGIVLGTAVSLLGIIFFFLGRTALKRAERKLNNTTISVVFEKNK